MNTGFGRRAIFILAVMVFLAAAREGIAGESSGAFYRELFDRPAATVEDVVRCAAAFHGSSAAHPGGNSTLPVTKGFAADVMLAGIDHKSSLAGLIFPKSRRYAFRSALYLNLLPPESHANEPMSGAELLAFVSKLGEEFRPAEFTYARRPNLEDYVRALRESNDEDAPKFRLPVTGILKAAGSDVEIRKKGGGTWTAARGEVELERGDEIATGLFGRATLKFGMVSVEILPLTQLTVGVCFQDGYEHSTEFFLKYGKIVTAARKKPGRAVRSSVVSRSAVSGIHGTVQEIAYREGFGSAVRTDEGSGYVAPVSPDRLPDALQVYFGLKASGAGSGDLSAWLDASYTARAAAELRSGEPLKIGSGMEAAVQDAAGGPALTLPQDVYRSNSTGDFFAAGTPDFEKESALLSTEIQDVPAAKLTQDELQSDYLQATTSTSTSTNADAYISARRPPLPP